MFLVIATLIICIAISAKTNINGGILAIFGAWLIGCVVLGKTISSLLTYWPMTVMFIFISTSLFFGVARANGTFDLLVAKMLFKFKNATKFLPFIMFFICYIAAACGAGAVGTQLLISPFAWALAKATGGNPIMFMISCWLGAVAGGGSFWAPEGASRLAYYAETVGYDVSLESCAVWTVYAFVGFLFVCILYYVIFRGWKLKGTTVLEKPEAFNSQQKRTIGVIIFALLLILIPALARLFFPNDITKALATMFDVQCVCIIGFLVSCALRLCGDGNKIINYIPMDLILTVCGFSVLIKVAIDYNLPEFLSQWILASNIPVFLIPALFLFIAGVISVFSNFAVIYPLLMPLIPVICMSTGINSLSLLIGLSYGSVLCGFSPFSVGGATMLSGCPDEKTRQKMIIPMIIVPLSNMVLFMIISATGIFGILPDPLAPVLGY